MDKKKKQELIEKNKGFLGEFKEFISKGNVIDLAVGVVVGGAFSTIVNSLVNDIIMPFIGALIGKINFSDFMWTIPNTDATIKYGLFIQNIINFLIIAWCIFLVVKFINRLKRRVVKEEEKAIEAVVDEKIELLKEIRDLLKK